MMSESTQEPIYLQALSIENVKCFRDWYGINFTRRDGKYAQWTVIIGNNNTGKTTLLKVIAGLELKNYGKIKSKQEYNSLYVPNGFFWREAIFGPTDKNIERALKNKISQGDITAQLSLPISSYADADLLRYGIQSTNGTESEKAFQFIIYAYGTSRRTSTGSLSEGIEKTALDDLISDKTELLNTEEWLLQTDYAIKNGSTIAKKVLINIQDIFLKSNVFPDIKDLRFTTTQQLKSFVEVETAFGWVKLSDLGYGYQVTISWLADLAKRMFDRYPELDNPLHGPAIVLVDEIDLHLHPEWQRKIIKYLSDLFLNTQFIVTAHSPLIVQSAENVNLIMLEKDNATGSINVRQQFGSFQGWTVEEILRELMDMGEKTRSDRYLELMRQFEDGLLADDYEAVKAAYDALDTILSPSSHQRKVLQIQMSSLIPA
jgi:predicted ATP-binding protein involved in virulence